MKGCVIVGSVTGEGLEKHRTECRMTQELKNKVGEVAGAEMA